MKTESVKKLLVSSIAAGAMSIGIAALPAGASPIHTTTAVFTGGNESIHLVDVPQPWEWKREERHDREVRNVERAREERHDREVRYTERAREERIRREREERRAEELERLRREREHDRWEHHHDRF